MAKLSLHAINSLSEHSYENKIIKNYLKRLPWKLEIKEFETKTSLPPDKQKLQEGALLLKSIDSLGYVIALDEKGKQFSSEEFSKHLFKIEKPLYFIIGGAYGLSEEVKARANMMLSLGQFTLPHALARAVLVEQIYRAFTIKQGHPYHK